MSLLGAPLDLIDRLMGQRAPSIGADDPAARVVARASARLRPSSRFRKRLRTNVVNRYVAVREGLVTPPVRRREMGRLGRAVLYATFATAVGVSSVGAASSSSLPGDPLYAIKLRLEAIRMQIAPSVARPMLAELALDARLSELEQLARDARWNQVPVAVAGVKAAEDLLETLGGPGRVEALRLQHHVDVLTALLPTAPDSARQGLQVAISASASHGPTNAPGRNGQANHPSGPSGTGQGNNQAGGGRSGAPAPSRSPHPAKSPPE